MTFIKKILNPIEYFSEIKVAIFGLIISAISIVMSIHMNIVLDGYLDIHDLSLSPFLSEFVWTDHIVIYIFNIVSMSVPMLLSAYIINRKTRLVDVLNAVIISRWPTIITMLVVYAMSQNAGINELIVDMSDIENLNTMTFDITAMTLLVVYSLILLLMLILQIVIFYLSYNTAVHSKTGMHKILFFVSLLIGEIISKIIISSIYL